MCSVIISTLKISNPAMSKMPINRAPCLMDRSIDLFTLATIHLNNLSYKALERACAEYSTCMKWIKVMLNSLRALYFCPLGKASLEHLEDFVSRLTPDFLKSPPCPPLEEIPNTELTAHHNQRIHRKAPHFWEQFLWIGLFIGIVEINFVDGGQPNNGTTRNCGYCVVNV